MSLCLDKLKLFPHLVKEASGDTDVRVSGWFIAAWSNSTYHSDKQKQPDTSELNDLLHVNLTKVDGCRDFIKSKKRTLDVGEAVISSGHVGNYGAWVLAVRIS